MYPLLFGFYKEKFSLKRKPIKLLCQCFILLIGGGLQLIGHVMSET